MRDDVLSSFGLDRDRRHGPATGTGAISRVDVDMAAPEAIGAVVGVAVPLHDRSAVETGKIFDGPLESPRHARNSISIKKGVLLFGSTPLR